MQSTSHAQDAIERVEAELPAETAIALLLVSARHLVETLPAERRVYWAEAFAGAADKLRQSVPLR